MNPSDKHEVTEIKHQAERMLAGPLKIPSRKNDIPLGLLGCEEKLSGLYCCLLESRVRAHAGETNTEI